MVTGVASGFSWGQAAEECLKCGHVAADNGRRAFKAVVIPAAAAANLEAFVATLNAVPGVAVAVVGALGYIHLGADHK